MHGRSVVLVAAGAVATAMMAPAAVASRPGPPAGLAGSPYGAWLDGSTRSGDWYEFPAASGDGTVTRPRSFAVVVKGVPRPGLECRRMNNPCTTLTARWTVACRRPGGGSVRSLQGAKNGRSPVVARPKLPFLRPRRCSISAGGALAYGAGGRLSVAIYYRR